jgi:hypothetical protein
MRIDAKCVECGELHTLEWQQDEGFKLLNHPIEFECTKCKKWNWLSITILRHVLRGLDE